ncbi:lactonase family protein [Metabacillus arenae]|uniref:Lactonase family protein n=1 Tax=Metabacillus arenae TaxID=2771434 RepID=A0A926NEU1_9BACI|nr:lactonase family protein [Metabacillus arenae]MBD1382184.1 lactonase family protein [Metabacillus arenae]
MKALSNQQFIGYVGTYTRGDSKGVYRFLLDKEAKKIVDVKEAAELKNPTYVTVSSDNQYLFAVKAGDEKGGVAGYSINTETGELEEINDQLSPGANPCHVSINKDNTAVVTANYHKGTIESYQVNADNGQLSPAASIIQHEGSGPNLERQEKAHAHYSGFTPDEKYVIAVDLGIDKVNTYKLVDGKLTEASSLSVKPGSGPRHIAFHPNGETAYIITELSSEVIVVKYNPQDGSFTELQTISTIPADFNENNQCSAIHVTSDGSTIYAGNRGHNSIAVYKADGAGKLTFIEHLSSEGNWPRDFVLDPSEEFLVVTNEKSSNMALYERDKATNTHTLLQSDITVPDPVCVKFLNV